MAETLGLTVQFVTSFHRCGNNVGDECFIDLPPWIVEIGRRDSNIFFKDQYGDADPEYITFGADDERIFRGRTPIDIYRDFFQAIANTFSQWMPKTINEIQVGLGPTGELRYPAYQLRDGKWEYCGIGEFQCYDRFLLVKLKNSSIAAGKPEWGLRGPTNAGHYNSRPEETQFFNGGFDDYQSPYGKFFLSWYFDELKHHARKILRQAKGVFGPRGVNIAAKVAGIHWWYNTPHHAAEVTTGYYNTGGRNAYYELAQLFAETNTTFCFTCLEMKNQDYCASAPETLVRQTMEATESNRIAYSGENAIEVCQGECRAQDFDQIVRIARSMRKPMKHFTYLRLRDSMFSPGNWEIFTSFVRRMQNPDLA